MLRESCVTFAIVSLARTGSTSVYRVLTSDPVISIAYEPDFTLPTPSAALVRERCRELFAKYDGIKHVWDPNGWPFRNRDYVSRLDDLENSEYLLELNATVTNFAEKVVFLRRRNRLARTISDLVGQQSNLWGHNSDQDFARELAEHRSKITDVQSFASELAEYRRKITAIKFCPLDVQLVEWYVTNAWQQEDLLIDRTPEDRRLVLYYEDLFNNERWTRGDFSLWQELAAWVGVRPEFSDQSFLNLANPQRKYNSTDVFEQIPNYAELLRRFCPAYT